MFNRLTTKEGDQQLQVFTHHISDYTNTAIDNGFELIEIKEGFDKEEEAIMPRLISFVFRKV